MRYMDGTLEPMDHWHNIRTGCRLPHEEYLKDPDKLAELSGECKIIVKGVRHDSSINHS